jgi:glycine/D-amino acid oxidase-like deaminating enzyme
MKRRKVVIIGAGVLGLNAAVEMARDDRLDVTVLESGHPGCGSTGLSVGVFTSLYLTEEDIELRAYGIRRLDELARDHGLVLRRIGVLRLGRDAMTMQAYERSVELQKQHGLEGARVLEAREVEALVPHFDARGVVGALYSPHDGYLDGSELAATLAAVAVDRGARLQARTRALGLAAGTSTRHRVVTDRGECDADVIVNCAGPWGAQVGSLLGAPIRVVNERHEAYIFELPPEVEEAIPMVLDNVPGNDAEEGLYFRQEGERQLIAGLHSNSIVHGDDADPDDFFGGVSGDNVETIVRRVAGAFPALDGMAYRSGWAGLYPHSPDQRPVAGPHPENPDVLVGAGLGGIGLTLSPILGRVLAAWAVEEEPDSPAAWRALLPRPAVTGGQV